MGMGFGSGLHAWGFTLKDFAKIYANKFGMSESKLIKKLWGNNFWDPKEQKWVKKNPDSKLQRGYCEFVLKPLTQIQAFLPVMESFGFTEMLRKSTGGQAFPQMKFSHWQMVAGDIYKEGSSAQEIVMSVRKREGLKVVLPDFGDYYDRV